MSWRIEGEYLENCSCNVLCPCLTSNIQGPADYERCYVPFAIHIRTGESEGVSLDGLNMVLVADSPAVMGNGGWRMAWYIDEHADDRQREALHEIFSGEKGGPPEFLAGMTGERLGVKYVPITWESHNGRKRVEVPGIMEFEVEGITAPESDAAMEIHNIDHPMGNSLPIARGLTGVYNDPDYDLSFDNTGKNGHYRDILWQA